jgi:hypothetical protein
MRRRQQRQGGFLLGTALGVVAGVVGGTALLRRAAASDATIEVIGRPPDSADDVAGDRPAAEPAALAAQIQDMVERLKARWNVAMAAGREAAADRERELEAKLAFETKRVPPLEGRLIEQIEQRLPGGPTP